MSMRHAPENRFLTAPVWRVFAAQAVPMVLVLTMGGIQNIVDAVFLGRLVGADALSAVSIVFPALMILIALSSLTGGGMSSLLARHLGADRMDDAEAVFARAHGLALTFALSVIVLFFAFGRPVLTVLSGGPGRIADMAWTYLAISAVASPVQLLLSVHADTWRNEGRAPVMALLSAVVTLANIVLNYVLMVWLDMGVAGAALGTALATVTGLALLAVPRAFGAGSVPLGALLRHRWTGGWGPILALGAPLSLSFIGIALGSAIVLAVLRVTAGAAFADTVAAYGIVTRVYSFAYLPMMAVALATQSIVGNNVGAGLHHRSDATLRLAMGVILVYCLTVELTLLGANRSIGRAFVHDPAVVDQLGTILRSMLLLFFTTGPILILALYFQAVGQPARTAVLTLSKPFVIAPVLVISLGLIWGPPVIWLAYPIADTVLVVLALTVAVRVLRRHTTGPGFGLAAPVAEDLA
ncbi:MATE family efflux transporter [Chachezhania sediminis]|uniref:MATE family efflux transporter n=1 Tax=Chachezhania sediminis TaxID=2599291 RepID=UPI00131A8FC9|nr:MATE family efflux transporter [Chachezhania sediminis]